MEWVHIFEEARLLEVNHAATDYSESSDSHRTATLLGADMDGSGFSAAWTHEASPLHGRSAYIGAWISREQECGC